MTTDEHRRVRLAAERCVREGTDPDLPPTDAHATDGMPFFVETPEAIAAAVEARAVADARKSYEAYMRERFPPGRLPVTALTWATVQAPFVDETKKYRLREARP